MFYLDEIFRGIQFEGALCGTPALFIRFHGCNLRCPYCFGEGTKILMEDFTQRNIEEAKIGDRLISVTRHRPKGEHLRFCVGTITQVISRFAETVKIGKTCVTPSHKFLNPTHREYWQSVSSLNKKRLYHLPFQEQTVFSSSEYKRGYLAGAFAGDGCFTLFQKRWLRALLFAKDQEMIETAKKYIEDEFGFSPRIALHYTPMLTLRGIEETQSGRAKKILEGIKELDSQNYKTGFLAGFYDAEGTIGTKNEIRISNKEEGLIKRAERYARDLDFKTQLRFEESGMFNLRILNPAGFFCLTQPKILRKLIASHSLRTLNKEEVEVEQERHTQKVFNIAVDTGAYIADGFIVSNCDTQYAREGKGWPLDGGGLARIVAESVPLKTVILTGGEPTLQPLVEELVPLLPAEPFICIETNGTRPSVIKALRELIPDLWVTFSPKAIKDAEKIYAPMWELASEIKVIFGSLDEAFLVRATGERKPLFMQPMERDGTIDWEPVVQFVGEHPEWRMSFQTHKILGLK